MIWNRFLNFLSPSQLVKLAKRLKKEKVNVDIINFGEEVSWNWGHWLDLVISRTVLPQSRANTGRVATVRAAVTESEEQGVKEHVCHVFSPPQEVNTEKLTAFVNTLNGKDGTGSHLVTVPPGPSLADALISSPILAGEGGAMLGLGASDFEFGVDPSADPELALVSKCLPR
jgi:hypothetical protein